MKQFHSSFSILTVLLIALFPACKQRSQESSLADYRISPTGQNESPIKGEDPWPIPDGSGHEFSESDIDRILNEMQRIKKNHQSPVKIVASCHAATGQNNALTTWPAVAAHYYCLLAQGRGCFTKSIQDAAEAGAPISYRRAYEICTTTGYTGANYPKGDKLNFDNEGSAVFLHLMMQSRCTYSEASQRKLLMRWYSEYDQNFATPHGRDGDGIPKRGRLALQTACPKNVEETDASAKKDEIICKMHPSGTYAIAIRKSDSVTLGEAYFASKTICDRAVTGAKNGLLCTMHPRGGFSIPTVISNDEKLGANYFRNFDDCLDQIDASQNGIVCTSRQGELAIPTRIHDGKYLGEFYTKSPALCAISVRNSTASKVCTSYKDGIHYIPWDIINNKASQLTYVKGLDACNRAL